MASSNIHWGHSAANFLKGAATVAISGAIIVGCVYFIGSQTGYSGEDITEGIKTGASAVWSTIATAASSVWYGGLEMLGLCNTGDSSFNPETYQFEDCISCDAGTISDNFHDNPYIKYPVYGAVAGAGLMASAAVIKGVSNVVDSATAPSPARRQPGPNELREMTRRLQAAQAAQHRGA